MKRIGRSPPNWHTPPQTLMDVLAGRKTGALWSWVSTHSAPSALDAP